MSEFKMPSLGADMESAILMEWLVKEGDQVHKGEVIAEVETSKGVIEIEVFEDGVIEKILVEEETECAVGTPLAIIRSKDEDPEHPDSSVPHQDKPEETGKGSSFQPSEEPIQKNPSEKRVSASPAARKKAKALGINLVELEARLGRAVQLSDLDSSGSDTTSSSNDAMRQAISRAMSLSNSEVPHYYLSNSINMTPALEWLRELNAKRSIDQRILPAALLIHAVVKALQEVPELNGFWKDGTHQIQEQINPGIAIALRKGGLINPAILAAQKMSLDETMRSLDDLITRTRSGKLRSTEMTQQTISITNLGDLGVEQVYGVIYPPQVAIIGLGKIIDTPWAEGDSLTVRKVLQATLAGDHRATDGRIGGLFLDRLNDVLQKPEELL